MAMADKEIGSVLIAINSYITPKTHLEPLLNIDQAFADYIAAFYSRLFFHVEVLVDFSYKDLENKLKSFAQNSIGSRIAAVFLCHGGLNLSGAECIYTNDAHPVSVVEIENFFHMNCRDKNKYLFFDACRSDTSGNESTSRLVYKASVDKTFVVFSTLPFHKAYVGGSYSLWSYWFTQKIMNQMLLDNVVASVDDEIRSEIREKLRITHEGQVSEVSKLGAVENPNLRAIAAAENQGRTRDLSIELGSFITQMREIMTEYRQTVPPPIGTSLASSLPQVPPSRSVSSATPEPSTPYPTYPSPISGNQSGDDGQFDYWTPDYPSARLNSFHSWGNSHIPQHVPQTPSMAYVPASPNPPKPNQKYLERRKKNNEAIRISRKRRKLEDRAKELLVENEDLKGKVAQLESEIGHLREHLLQFLSNKGRIGC